MKAISAGATTRRRFSVRRIRSRESDPQGLVHADALRSSPRAGGPRLVAHSVQLFTARTYLPVSP